MFCLVLRTSGDVFAWSLTIWHLLGRQFLEAVLEESSKRKPSKTPHRLKVWVMFAFWSGGYL